MEKRDGNIRICGDYKLTVNKAAQTEVYPIPHIEEIFASLSGGKTFSKLDLSHAYQQVKLEEASQQGCSDTSDSLSAYHLHQLFSNVLWKTYFKVFQESACILTTS